MVKRHDKLAGKVALAASAALLAVALPSSVLAIGFLNEDGGLADRASRISFTPASADPAMAELIAERSGGQARMMRFTPAGAAASPIDRSVTVAVRVDQETAEAIAARSDMASSREGDSVLGGLRLAPTRYNLGIARGYGNFTNTPAAQSRTPTLSRTLSEADIPDLSAFTPRTSARAEQSRFAARVELDQDRPAGRQDARASVGDQMLDVGGSYRLSRNIDITAGVRYEQDRDIVPLPDVEQQDSQAVYIGTQFRF